MYEQDAIIKDVFKHIGVDISYLVAEGLLHINDARNWLVRREYFSLDEQGEMTLTKIKQILSKKYGMSISCIEKLIYRN